MKKRAVLVTGCNGYLGTEVCWHFSVHGWYVVGLDKREPAQDQGEYLDAFYKEKLWRSKLALDYPFDAIVHLAGASRPRPGYTAEEYQRNNVKASAVLRSLYPQLPIIYASTMSIYNEGGYIDHDEMSLYASSKKAGEEYADVVINFGTIVGANRLGNFMSFIDCMIHDADTSGRIYVLEGDKKRGILTLDAAVGAIFEPVSRMLGMRVPGEFNKCAQTCISIREGASMLATFFNVPVAEVNSLDDIVGDAAAKSSPADGQRVSYVKPNWRPTVVDTAVALGVAYKAIERYDRHVHPLNEDALLARANELREEAAA